VVDVGGRRVVPGLNDSHLHAIRGGLMFNLELRWDGVDSLARGLEMIREQPSARQKASGCAGDGRLVTVPVHREANADHS
jgi:predicted amidohydrolase YtcJ